MVVVISTIECIGLVGCLHVIGLQYCACYFYNEIKDALFQNDLDLWKYDVRILIIFDNVYTLQTNYELTICRFAKNVKGVDMLKTKICVE